MARDLTVILEDRPGTLADMSEALGSAGINIDGVCGITQQGKGDIHILVEDAAGARQVLEANGMDVSAEREVLVMEVEDQPGALGEISRSLANAGVNIEFIYAATHTRLVMAVDDLEKARGAV
jgi:hypothetical protein